MNHSFLHGYFMMNHRSETKRFILRPFLLTDLDDFFELDADPEVHKYLGNTPIKTKEEMATVIGAVQQQYLENGIGRWAVEDKVTGEVVGWSGLKLEKEALDFEYYDVGFRIKKKHWGKGIATEAGLESVRYAFMEMHLDKIGGGAEIDHGASNHVLQKIGLHHIETIAVFGKPHHWYELEKTDWLKNNRYLNKG